MSNIELGNLTRYLMYQLSLFGLANSFFAITPSDTLVFAGESTQLNCTYEITGYPAWYKGQQDHNRAVAIGNVIIDNDTQYEIIGDEDNIRYNLRILNVDMENEDYYECGDQVNVEQRAQAYVYVMNNIPECSIEPSTILKARENATLNCTVDLKKDSPGELVWLSNEVEIHREEGRQSTVTLQMDKSDNGATFKCQLQHFTVPSWKWSDLTCKNKFVMVVQYVSEFTLAITPTTVLTEGEEVTVICKALDGNPGPYLITLSHDEKVITFNNGADLYHQIYNISRLDKGVYKCEAFTRFFDESEHYWFEDAEMVVHYPPSINTTDKTVEALIGDVVHLLCSADGFPTPTIIWFDSNDDTILGEEDNGKITAVFDNKTSVTSSLNITIADESYYGKYTCEALNEIQPSAQKTMYIIKPPAGSGNTIPIVLIVTCLSVNVVIIAYVIGFVFFYRRYFQKDQANNTVCDYAVDSSDDDNNNPDTSIALHEYEEIRLSRVSDNYTYEEPISQPSLKKDGENKILIRKASLGKYPLQSVHAKTRNTKDDKTSIISITQNVVRRNEDQSYQPLSLQTMSKCVYAETTEIEPVEVSRELINLGNTLGRGTFGRVVKAEVWNIAGKLGVTQVAVKILKESALDEDKRDFLDKLKLMKVVGSHPNIVSLLGYCTETEPYYMLFEYMTRGDLLTFLRNSRNIDGAATPNLHGDSITLGNADLISFAIHVAMGMEFLSAKGCIHRHLAASNVLVDEHNVCKIADIGLARDVIEEDQYERNTQARLPIRWMSIESLLDGIFTTMSDVWSFGILLWELATIGYKPYPGMSGQEVISSLQEGYRMPKPLNCDEEFYAVMLSCWHKEPGKRPTFSELVTIIKELANDDKNHISVYPIEQDHTKADGCEDD